MSCYLEDKAHIDALIRAAMSGDGLWFYWGPETEQDVIRPGDYVKATEIGRMLWATNFLSVAHRYGTEKIDDLPGPNGLTRADILGYEYEPAFFTPSLEPVEVLKAVQGYEYQTCEIPDWRETKAWGFCHYLTSKMIGELPGYDEANTWSIAGVRHA